MTYEEFLDWAQDGTYAEWVNGEVILLSPNSSPHQSLLVLLSALLRYFVDARRLGIVLCAPFQMKTAADLPGREPDIFFLPQEHLDRLQRTYIKGPADLVVEIVGSDSRARDRGEKFYEYEQGGVREYWLPDFDRKRSEFYHLGDDGLYRPIPIGEGGVFRSVVLEGFWLKVEWLWEPPPLLTILKQWNLV